ncbi:MAG: ribosome maturation factor RimM [Bacilli bacterium]
MYLQIGKISKNWGLKGEVKVYSCTDFANLRYKKNNTVYLKEDDKYIPLKVNTYRKYQTGIDLVSFTGYDSLNSVEAFFGKEIYALKEEISLPKNTFFYSDLKGLNAYSPNEKYLGVVENVKEYPAGPSLLIRVNEKNTVLVPFIAQFINKVDLENQKIYINEIEGLF